jgi:isopenicillin-N N-acyltransferase-like protein
MGYQHAEQIVGLRPAILDAIASREAQIARDGEDEAFRALVAETRSVVATTDPAIVGFVSGLADGLDIPLARLLDYNLVPFLRDVLVTSDTVSTAGMSEGCSAWAASGTATSDGTPLLAKARDYRLEHLVLQTVVRAEPESGYRYTYITSAGSPGVFVAGFNEAGLAIVDTHVSSRDVGPGVPAYALAMHVLEEQENVGSALAYLRSRPLLGRNNFLLADSRGDLALFEMGHRQRAILQAERGVLITTNHFNSPVMRPSFVDISPPELRGNTYARYRALQEALAHQRGKINLSRAQEILAFHDGSLASICRHPTPTSESSTIAAVIFRPAQREMHFCHGRPCLGRYETFAYVS